MGINLSVNIDLNIGADMVVNMFVNMCVTMGVNIVEIMGIIQDCMRCFLECGIFRPGM